MTSLSRYLLVLSLIGVFTLTGKSGFSYGFCTAPSDVSCVDMLGISRDQLSFDLCHSELESYQQQLQSYINCVQDEISEHQRKLNEAIERFNCYASGRTIC